MMRRSGLAGFDHRPTPVMSSRLTGAVAATLTIAALSLSLIVALNVLSANTPIGLAG